VGKGQWPGELGGPVTSEVLWVIGSSVWLKLLLQSLIDMLGVIEVNVLDLLFSQGPQAHVQPCVCIHGTLPCVVGSEKA